MSGKVLLTSSVQCSEYIYNILNQLTVKLKITKNDFGIPPELLFDMAARINKKRSFLFVSKVLGKHLPVNPETPLLASSLLASKYMKEVLKIDDDQIPDKLDQLLNQKSGITFKPYRLVDKTIFIGFAETATALGHGVFENFQNAFFFHTTRELIDNHFSIIHFEEEHSHSTSHFCYIDSCHLDNQHPIVLVDDELTTGKTVLNIIRSIHKRYPRHSYTILTLLDWRNENSIQQFIEVEKSLGIDIRIVSLISGYMDVKSQLKELKDPSNQSNDKLDKSLGTMTDIWLEDIKIMPSPYYHHSTKANYIWETGRFGLESKEQEGVEKLAREIGLKLFQIRSGKKALCIGTGEFMYLPMKIAAYMGEEIYYQSTTRSPIYAIKDKNYLIQNKLSYPSPEHSSIVNYLYEIESNSYDEVFVFFEREHPAHDVLPLLRQLANLIPKVYTVTLSKREAELVNAFGRS